MEISEREHLIEQLTESLQQSMQMREHSQIQCDKLTSEVVQLRKQLTDAMDAMRRPLWMRDHESVGAGQRISEISIDLVSESDLDDVDDKLKNQQHLLTDGEGRSRRSSKERQIIVEPPAPQQQPLMKQIEQFQKFLSPDELRIFFMVQHKFNDYLSEEVEKIRIKYDVEMKAFNDGIESEKHEKESEVLPFFF